MENINNFLVGPTKFGPRNYLFKGQASYHFIAWEFRNLRAFDFFQLLPKLSFKSNLELRNSKIIKLSVLIKTNQLNLLIITIN